MRLMIPIIALAAAACNPQTESGSDPVDAQSPTPAVTDSEAAGPAIPEPAAPPGEDGRPETKSDGSFDLSEETDLYLFEYKYPTAVGANPELAALLDRRQERAKASLARTSSTARDEARDRGFPYNKHSYQGEWKVVTDLPDWLSLSLEFATYSGGAHGMYGIEALLWDKNGHRALKGINLFTSPAALYDASSERFCELLNQEREKRRGQPVDPERDELFSQCPGIEELTVLLGSSNRRAFDRMTFYAGPYVAGPYAEGAFEINLPVTAAVVDAVDPQYREFFRARN